MQTLFVMIKCELGRAYDVATEAVDRLEHLSEIHSVSGQYDLLAKFYLPAGTDPGRFVTSAVQTIPGVRDTFTILAFNAFVDGGSTV